VEKLHGWMTSTIRARGGTIDDVRYCPFHPEGRIPKYRSSSNWRKPGPEMILDLARSWKVDMSRSFLIGDNDTDLEAAKRAGIPGYLFQGGNLFDFVSPILAKTRR